MRRAAAAVALLAICGAAAAQPARWYVQADNDALLDTDRWYSSGLRIARVAPRGGHELEVGLLQEIYAPEAERFELDTVDRAPTARLLAYAARHDRSEALFQTIELAAGVRGPSALGEEVTDLVHRLVSAADIAWSRQEGDRFDAHAAFVRTHRFGHADVHYGAVVGSQQAFAHAGAEWRFGARAISSPVLRFAATPPPPAGAQDGWGGFVGASVRGVARNAMIGRPYYAFGERLERRDAVGRAAAGATWARGALALSLVLAVESREFAGQRAAHAFGSMTLGATF